MKKHLIALLTDFGLTDQYAGLLKASILSIFPEAQIIDLCHVIAPQNIIHGAVLLEVSYAYFPKGTIFVGVVDPGVGTSRKILCIQTRDYFFIGPDNGLLSLAVNHERVLEMRSIENRKYFLKSPASATFHGRDIMAPAAAHIARRPQIFFDLGPVVSRMQGLKVPSVHSSKKVLTGSILYFDQYGNGMTNIRRKDASPKFWQKAEIGIGAKRLGGLKKTYGSHLKLIALFNSFGQLEIALPGGSAQKAASLKRGQIIKIS